MCCKIRTILYHGTVSEIQAVGMMHKKYREPVRRSRRKQVDAFRERLYEITLDGEIVSRLNVKIFEKADIEWLDFILICRVRGGMPHNYDLVIGPTADDDTTLCLKAYWDGLYGKTGSEAAKKELLDNLETDNLGIQYFIGKQEVAEKVIIEMKECDWR